MTDRHAAPCRARRSIPAPHVFALCLALVPLAVVGLAPSGCAFRPTGITQQPVPPPLNSTPQGAILRLQRLYENQDAVNYAALLTADFRYTFSAQSDPALATTWGTNWGKIDEVDSAEHLFSGFVNTEGKAVPPATRIQVNFVNDQYYPDPVHADSGAWYVYCPVTNVNLTIDVPVDAGGTTTYNIAAPHSFFLVRGDAAFLDAGQPADSTHWYVRHWDDHSPPPGTNPATLPSLAAESWGGIKGAHVR